LTPVNSSRKNNLEVTLLTENDWERYRDIRLRALQSDGDAFGGDLSSESGFTEAQWREKARKYVGIIASIEGADCGFMTIENLKGDFSATCWVGSCCNIHTPSTKNINVYPAKTSRCCHCYILSENCINKILDEIININEGIDWYYNDLIKKLNLNAFWFEPSLAEQSGNFSTTVQN
jgi:hypothetical protein